MKEQQASVAALVAVGMRLSYKSREENEVLTFWCFCVKTKARKNFLKLNKRN